jgi:AcrR family transcriptional regulator
MTTGKAPAKRGRPARFSREQIVDAVAAMLLADPRTPLTIARAAEAVGARPMSLYRHFADRDDLVAAVAQRLFAESRVPTEPDATWQEEVAAWMRSVYRMATRVPQLVQLAASGESAGWIVDSAHLAAIVERSGVHDERLVAEAVYWVSTTTLGHALIYAAGEQTVTLDRLQKSLEWMEPEDAQQVTRLLPHLELLRESGFERIVEWTIEAVEARLTPRRRRR